jgi:lactate dehydrogenase-like 2-hydroxyacid dehydrogenase
VHRLYSAADRAALLREVGPAVRGIATGGRLGANGDIIDALPKLEIIAINGAGTDAVDLERARARGIHVTTTPDVFTVVVRAAPARRERPGTDAPMMIDRRNSRDLAP